MMLCNQLREKVISRLRPCSETQPVLAPPGWQYQYWLQWQIGLVFVALLPFSYAISRPCSTPQFICPLLLTSSSRRLPYLRYHRKYLRRRRVPVQATERIFLCQQSAAFQRKLSVLRGNFSNSIASSPTNNGFKSELDDNELDNLKKKI